MLICCAVFFPLLSVNIDFISVRHQDQCSHHMCTINRENREITERLTRKRIYRKYRRDKGEKEDM